MAKFKAGVGNWTQYRSLPGIIEVDFHHGRRDRWVPYENVMYEVYVSALQSLKDAQAQGHTYVLFTHGHSTSRRGRTTARYVIRGLIRSPEATPYVNRAECIQHDSVFVVCIKSPRSLCRAHKHAEDCASSARM